MVPASGVVLPELELVLALLVLLVFPAVPVEPPLPVTLAPPPDPAPGVDLVAQEAASDRAAVAKATASKRIPFTPRPYHARAAEDSQLRVAQVVRATSQPPSLASIIASVPPSRAASLVPPSAQPPSPRPPSMKPSGNIGSRQKGPSGVIVQV
jgi:hypothetical protein